MKIYQIILFLGTVMLTFCVPASWAATGDDTCFSAEEFRVVSSGLQTGLKNPQVRVIIQKEEFASLLSEISITGNTVIPDFYSNFLVAIFPGPIYGCKYEPSVESVIDTGAALTVNVLLQFPPPDTVCTTVVDYTSPYLFVEVPHTTKPISVFYHVVNK